MRRCVFFDVSSFFNALNGTAGGWFMQQGIWNVGVLGRHLRWLFPWIVAHGTIPNGDNLIVS